MKEAERKKQNEDINRMIKDGEPLFSVVLDKYDWNAVQRAQHNPNKRRKEKRREEYDDDVSGL